MYHGTPFCSKVDSPNRREERDSEILELSPNLFGLDLSMEDHILMSIKLKSSEINLS